MNLSCIVCRELLGPSDEVNVAPCGHFFHYICWVGWLERSKTCPQCRKKTTEKQLVRVYFNIAEGGGEDIEDAASFNQKIDSLTFNLRLKEKDLSNAKEDLEKEVNHNKGLREELKKYKAKLDDAHTNRQCLEEKVKYLQQQGREAEEAKAQVLSLRSKVDRLQRMDTILHGNIEDVQKVLDTTSFSPEGMRSLGLFTASLKRALEEAKERREVMKQALNSDRIEIRKLKSQIGDLTKSLETADVAKRHLEEDVKHLELEKKTLAHKISELEKAILSPSADSARDKALRRFISESPAPNTFNLTGAEETDENVNTPVLAGPGRSFVPSQHTSSQNTETVELDGSPFLGVRPNIVKGLSNNSQANLKASGLSKMSIFNKRLQLDKDARMPLKSFSGEAYDGLGGHSKLDDFPEPIVKKFKKHKSAPVGPLKTKKVSAPAGVPKLNQFDGFIKINL